MVAQCREGGAGQAGDEQGEASRQRPGRQGKGDQPKLIGYHAADYRPARASGAVSHRASARHRRPAPTPSMLVRMPMPSGPRPSRSRPITGIMLMKGQPNTLCQFNRYTPWWQRAAGSRRQWRSLRARASTAPAPGVAGMCVRTTRASARCDAIHHGVHRERAVDADAGQQQATNGRTDHAAGVPLPTSNAMPVAIRSRPTPRPSARGAPDCRSASRSR